MFGGFNATASGHITRAPELFQVNATEGTRDAYKLQVGYLVQRGSSAKARMHHQTVEFVTFDSKLANELNDAGFRLGDFVEAVADDLEDARHYTTQGRCGINPASFKLISLTRVEAMPMFTGDPTTDAENSVVAGVTG